MTTLADIRAKYPDYSDLSDAELADRLHSKFYADMPRADFDTKIGLAPQAAEPTVSVGYDVARQGVGHMAKGIVGTALGLPYSAVRHVLDPEGGISIPGIGSARLGEYGVKLPAFEDMDLYKPWTNQPKAETAAGKFAGSMGEAIGSSAVPAMGIMQKAKQVDLAAPAANTLAQSFLRPIAEKPGLATAIDVASAAGSGAARQAAEDEELGPTGETLASMIGGISAPVGVISGVRGARAVGEAAFERLPKIRMSADGGVPSNAARERAIQMAADQLTRAGVSKEEIERRLADVDWARTFHTSGKAQDAMTLADLDESLARLLGSAVRQQPEAANTARGFLHARQSGLEPETPLHSGAGIPTREAMAKPVTGKEAVAEFGTDFGAGQDNFVPTGQHERVVDTLKRAFRIKDTDFHGHAANANRTDEQLIASSKALSKPAYDDTYAAGRGVDLQPHLVPVIRKWMPEAAPDSNEPEEVRRLIGAILKRFASVRNIEQFDKNKQFALDAKIEKLFQSIEGRNRYVGGRLTDLKHDLLAAVDGIGTNDLGAKYQNARDIFSSHAEARRVIKMGREAFGEESDVGIDAFNALAGKGDQKLFQLGYLGAVEKKSAGMPSGADRTRLFDNPRQRQILANIIDRTAGEGRTFSDRPQRFGGYLGDEGRMVRTRETISGNSKTAEREADDLAFDTLHTILDVFKDPRLLSIGKRGLELAFNKAFGMRADTSAELARVLLTADPARRTLILKAVQERMGSTRFQRFSEIMREYQRQSVTGTTGGLAGVSESPAEQP